MILWDLRLRIYIEKFEKQQIKSEAKIKKLISNDEVTIIF